MMRSLFTSALLLVTIAPAARCQATIPADAAREDILQLGSLLERVHPDPYAGFGGRVSYQTAFQDLLEEVPEGDVSVRDLRLLIARFLGAMGDGHTGISSTSSSDPEVPRLYLPVQFAVSADGVYISDATQDFAFLSGARVIEVEGIPSDEMARRMRVFFPSENLPGSRRQLASRLASLRSASDLLPAVQTALRLTVESADTGERAEVTMEYSLSLEERRAGPWLRDQVSAVDEPYGPFFHRLLDDGRIGYLRLRAMWSRGAFETMRANGRTDLQQWLTHAYDRFLNAPPAPDVAAAIEGFPSLIEEVSALLRAVREQGARDIIIDLRGNDGGFSIVGEPLLYQLFGRAYLDAPSPAYFATRVSEELLSLRGQTLGELAAYVERDLRMGDFIFDPPRGHPRPTRTPAEFINDLRNEGFTAAHLLSEPHLDLQVVAIVDAATFSAAFDLAYQLHRMGAALVGNPPSQSPRAFTDSTPFRLGNSGLEGSMSRSAVVYPGIPSEAGVVALDMPLTWEALRQLDFHPDAPVHAAVEFLRARR